MTGFVKLIAGTFLCSLLMLTPAYSAKNESVGTAIEQIITSGHLNLGNSADDQRLFQIFTFYQDRNYKPVWTRDTGIKGKGKALFKALKNAHEHGLNPEFYDTDAIAERMDATNPEVLAELDFLLSMAFADFASDLTTGHLKPSRVNSELHLNPHGPGPLSLIDGAEEADKLDAYIYSLAEKNPRYGRLKQKLAEYRELASLGELPKIPAGKALKPGMDDPRVPAIRKLLLSYGDLANNENAASTTYDDELVTAVKHFQQRHGRTQDGVIGPSTLKAMNVPISYRIKQMKINLERRRWMSKNLGKRYVFVNQADQILKVVDTLPDREKTRLVARIVVGKPFHRTPVFSDKMEYLVINPYWNVPPSIANKEYLPKLRRDPGYLQRQNIRILSSSGEVNPYSVNWNSISRIPYRLRQDSGGRNALGRLKFIFPNKYNVYIHDTPSKSLFNRDTRYFSHGCMRVQYPVKLAAVLLKPQGWSEQRIRNQIASGKRRIVRLKTKIPVHVTYLTSWVNKDGTVNFRKDVYGRDKRLMKALLK